MQLRPGALEEIRAYTIQGVPHQCHWPQTHGQKKTLACRGARDYLLTIWHRMGLIDAPTDEALEVARLKHTTAKEIP